MIKKISIEYCEANGKYDLIVEGEYCGKHYTIEEAIKGLPRAVSYYETLKVE